MPFKHPKGRLAPALGPVKHKPVFFFISFFFFAMIVVFRIFSVAFFFARGVGSASAAAGAEVSEVSAGKEVWANILTFEAEASGVLALDSRPGEVRGVLPALLSLMTPAAAVGLTDSAA